MNEGGAQHPFPAYQATGPGTGLSSAHGFPLWVLVCQAPAALPQWASKTVAEQLSSRPAGCACQGCRHTFSYCSRLAIAPGKVEECPQHGNLICPTGCLAHCAKGQPH